MIAQTSPSRRNVLNPPQAAAFGVSAKPSSLQVAHILLPAQQLEGRLEKGAWLILKGRNLPCTVFLKGWDHQCLAEPHRVPLQGLCKAVVVGLSSEPVTRETATACLGWGS